VTASLVDPVNSLLVTVAASPRTVIEFHATLRITLPLTRTLLDSLEPSSAGRAHRIPSRPQSWRVLSSTAMSVWAVEMRTQSLALLVRSSPSIAVWLLRVTKPEICARPGCSALRVTREAAEVLSVTAPL
jgi:hypothetical protein